MRASSDDKLLPCPYGLILPLRRPDVNKFPQGELDRHFLPDPFQGIHRICIGQITTNSNDLHKAKTIPVYLILYRVPYISFGTLIFFHRGQRAAGTVADPIKGGGKLRNVKGITPHKESLSHRGIYHCCRLQYTFSGFCSRCRTAIFGTVKWYVA